MSFMKSYRIHGASPFISILLHGGPGAIGDLNPVALELSKKYGVIEFIQTKTSMSDLIEDIRDILDHLCKAPVVVFGHSWGAWLACLFCEKYPQFVSKLILVGTPPFEEAVSNEIMNERISRLTKKEQNEIFQYFEIMQEIGMKKGEKLNRFLELITKADSYAPIASQPELLNFEPSLSETTWNESWEMRNSGKLMEVFEKINCPVVVIHGDYDPHPIKGVKDPCSRLLEDFMFYELEKCGHSPWRERFARDRFFEILANELLV